MTRLALSSVSSLRRDIGSQCTVLRIHKGRVYAGSQEGTLACWMTDSGEPVWQVEMTGPLSDIDFGDDRVYVTESSMVHCLQYDSGEMVWSRELEGSSDYVVTTNDGVWATSSVYEIVIGDYTESTIWKFTESGDVEKTWTISERCWFFGSYGEGLLLGLGRPRCGALKVVDGQLEHLELGSGPVTCGTAIGKRILLGHSDGKISEFGSSTELAGKSPVSAVLGVGDEIIAGFEGGEVASSAGWSHTPGGSVTALSLGPYPSDNQVIWISLGNEVMVLNKDDGGNVLELSHECKIRKTDSNESLIVLGDTDGIIHFVEDDVLSRRLSDDMANTGDNARKREMMDRLRGLRKS